MARILLAEDDDSWRHFLSLKLKRAGHEVDSFGNGIEALSALRVKPYDLLLADIVMPGLDGIELSRRAVALAPEMRVIFITGFSALAMSQKSRMVPHAQVLSKPFHLNDLVDRIDEFLEEAQRIPSA